MQVRQAAIETVMIPRQFPVLEAQQVQPVPGPWNLSLALTPNPITRGILQHWLHRMSRIHNPRKYLTSKRHATPEANWVYGKTSQVDV